MKVQLNNVLYFGLFFDFLPSTLERDTERKHITFQFKPTEVPSDIMFETFTVKIVGYGNNGKNEGFLVELPDELKPYYKGQDKVHITLSTQGDGKPVDTGNISFQMFITPFEIEGVMDVFQTV